MAIDLNLELREGDVVRVTGKVRYSYGGLSDSVALSVGGSTVYVDRSDAELASTVIAVGDLVSYPKWSRPATVMAIVDDVAWVRWDEVGTDALWQVAELTRTSKPADAIIGQVAPSLVADAAE